MRDYKQLLATFIEVVTFLLAAFGGFLKNIAPPDQVGASFPVGFLSFLTLIVLMMISALGRRSRAKYTGRWITAGAVLFVLALPSVFAYRHMVSNFTYPQTLDLAKRQISATDAYLTTDARQYKAANPNATPEDLARNLPDGDVWTREGINKSESKLLAAYACLVLTIAASIFCLLEANMRANGNKNEAGQPDTNHAQDQPARDPGQHATAVTRAKDDTR
jgi:hypothetical protein